MSNINVNLNQLRFLNACCSFLKLTFKLLKINKSYIEILTVQNVFIKQLLIVDTN